MKEFVIFFARWPVVYHFPHSNSGFDEAQ